MSSNASDIARAIVMGIIIIVIGIAVIGIGQTITPEGWIIWIGIVIIIGGIAIIGITIRNAI